MRNMHRFAAAFICIILQAACSKPEATGAPADILKLVPNDATAIVYFSSGVNVEQKVAKIQAAFTTNPPELHLLDDLVGYFKLHGSAVSAGRPVVSVLRMNSKSPMPFQTLIFSPTDKSSVEETVKNDPRKLQWKEAGNFASVSDISNDSGSGELMKRPLPAGDVAVRVDAAAIVNHYKSEIANFTKSTKGASFGGAAAAVFENVAAWFGKLHSADISLQLESDEFRASCEILTSEPAAAGSADQNAILATIAAALPDKHSLKFVLGPKATKLQTALVQMLKSVVAASPVAKMWEASEAAFADNSKILENGCAVSMHITKTGPSYCMLFPAADASKAIQQYYNATAGLAGDAKNWVQVTKKENGTIGGVSVMELRIQYKDEFWNLMLQNGAVSQASLDAIKTSLGGKDGLRFRGAAVDGQAIVYIGDDAENDLGGVIAKLQKKARPADAILKQAFVDSTEATDFYFELELRGFFRSGMNAFGGAVAPLEAATKIGDGPPVRIQFYASSVGNHFNGTIATNIESLGKLYKEAQSLYR